MGDRRQIGRVAHPGGERAGQRQGRVRGDQQRHEDENPMGDACHSGRIVSHRSGNVTGSTVERVPLRPMTREMPPGLEIRVLGPLEVLVDGAPLVVDTRKALAILVLLGVERRAVAREAAVRAPDVATLRGAAELARGSFLAGFTLRDSPDFDDWRATRASAVERSVAGVLDLLAAAADAGGDTAGAVAAASRRVDLDPLDGPG